MWKKKEAVAQHLLSSPTPSAPGQSWGPPSPGILCIAVVDVFRDGIILKEVCKLALEVWTESLHQPRPWDRVGESNAGRVACAWDSSTQEAEAGELFQAQGWSRDA